MLDLLLFSGGLQLKPIPIVSLFYGTLPNGMELAFASSEIEHHDFMQKITSAIGIGSLSLTKPKEIDYIIAFGCAVEPQKANNVIVFASLSTIKQNNDVKRQVWHELKKIFL